MTDQKFKSFEEETQDYIYKHLHNFPKMPFTCYFEANKKPFKVYVNRKKGKMTYKYFGVEEGETFGRKNPEIF